MDILLTFAAANPWLTFFLSFLITGVIMHTLSCARDIYINTIWCIRGKYLSHNAVNVDELKCVHIKEEDDENKLKDCR
jgi:hypothetical protein